MHDILPYVCLPTSGWRGGTFLFPFYKGGCELKSFTMAALALVLLVDF